MGTHLSSDEAIDLGARLNSHFEQSGLHQLQIQAATGVHQSQISRILAGDFKFVTPKVEALCKFAGVNYAKNRSVSPRGDVLPTAGPDRPHTTVLRAFEVVWDGSPRHADAIGDLIRAAGPLLRGST